MFSVSLVPQQWQQGKRMAIYGLAFLIMTLLILYSSNSTADLYSPFRDSHDIHRTVHNTNLKKWAGKDGYVPVYGNKVIQGLSMNKSVRYLMMPDCEIRLLCCRA